MDRSDAGGGIASNAIPEMGDVTLTEAGEWIDAYGQAWVNHDLEAGLALFTAGATFREARFKPAVIGQADLMMEFIAPFLAGETPPGWFD